MAAPENSPALTFILCSRNDRYHGNSRWRLETALNFLAHSVEELELTQRVEVIVTDWGSDTPLHEVVELSEVARRITKFLHIPPRIAKKEQKESVFPEVLANNAAIRRARGRFIGRIDQDTLVDGSFLTMFLRAVSESPGMFERSVLFSGRRSIPRRLTRRSPRLNEVVQFVRCFRRTLPREGRRRTPWFDMPVGIFILHRRLWMEAQGYDERLIHWGFMETELTMRLGGSHAIVNLEDRFGCPFYHLRHTGQRLSITGRRKNPRRPIEPAASRDNWGLGEYKLEFSAAVASAKREEIAGNECWPLVLRFALSVCNEWCWEKALALSRRLARGLDRGDTREPL